MKAIKAMVEGGAVILNEPLDLDGRAEAIVIVLDPDPWDAVVHDSRPRPKLVEAREQALADFAAGRTEPIDPDQMS